MKASETILSIFLVVSISAVTSGSLSNFNEFTDIAFNHAVRNINEARENGIDPTSKKFMPNTMELFKVKCGQKWEDKLQTNKINSKDLLIRAARDTTTADQWVVFTQTIAFQTLVHLNKELFGYFKNLIPKFTAAQQISQFQTNLEIIFELQPIEFYTKFNDFPASMFEDPQMSEKIFQRMLPMLKNINKLSLSIKELKSLSEPIRPTQSLYSMPSYVSSTASIASTTSTASSKTKRKNIITKVLGQFKKLTAKKKKEKKNSPPVKTNSKVGGFGF